MNEVESWWRGLPPVTRYLFTTSIAVTILTYFGMISPLKLVLDWYLVTHEFQFWRLITCFFYFGKPSLGFLLQMIFLIQYGQDLENNKFNGRSSEFVFFLLFGFTLIPFGVYFQLPILSISLIMMVIYYWSKVRPDIMMSFLFGLRFKSAYLPWVMAGFSFLTSGNPIYDLLGIVAGHIYYLIMDRIPIDYNIRLLQCPVFLKKLFNEPLIDPPQQAPYNRQQQQEGEQNRRLYNWGGRGYRLGDE